MMIRKMNRLSTEREYSVSQPAKNSVPYWWPAKTHTPMPKRTAIPMKNASAMLTSLREGSCGRRPMTTTSKSRTSVVMPIVSHHTRGDTSMHSSGLGARVLAERPCDRSGPEVSSAACERPTTPGPDR